MALQPLGLELNAEIQMVDLWQDRQLSAFCRGCTVVVNCAGPSYQVLDRGSRQPPQVHITWMSQETACLAFATAETSRRLILDRHIFSRHAAGPR